MKIHHYKIVQQLGTGFNGSANNYTVYKKRWCGWRSINIWFASVEAAEKHITKLNLMRGQFPVIKELHFI